MKPLTGLLSFLDDEEIYDPSERGKPKGTVAWVKYRCVEDIHTIDDDSYLVFGSEVNITFYNVELRRPIVYQANDSDKGYGVQCIACHPKLNIFAYAEKRFSPYIYVREFPSCNAIITLPKGRRKLLLETTPKALIVNLAFTEARHLISVSRTPDREIIIWNWLTGTIVAKTSHDVYDLSLQMTCTTTFPIYMAIAGKTSSQCSALIIHMVGRKCYVNKIKLAIEFSTVLNDISFSPTGALYAVDEECRIHCYKFSTLEADEVKILKSEQVVHERHDLPIRNFIQWTYDGVISTCCDGSIVCYDTETFDERWRYQRISLPPYTAFVVSYDRQYGFGINTKGELVRFAFFFNKEPKLMNRIKIGNVIRDFTPLYPAGRLFATLNEYDELGLFRKSNGNAVACFHVKNATVMTAHPHKPVLAVGRKDGVISFIDCEMPFRPALYLELSVTNRAIDEIHYVYTESSLIRIIVLSHSRHFMFLLRELPSSQIIILDLLVFKLPIIDFAPYQHEKSQRLFVYILIRDELNTTSANKMEFFTIDKNEKFMHVEAYDLLTPISTICMNNYRKKLILTSSDAHTFYIYDIRKEELDDDDGYESYHSMPGFTVFCGRFQEEDRLISYGYDGYLCMDLKLDFNEHPPDEVCRSRARHRSPHCIKTGPKGDRLCIHKYRRIFPRPVTDLTAELVEKQDLGKGSAPVRYKPREAVCLHRGIDEIDTFFMPHHWMNGGIKKVMLDPMKYCVYSLGYSGNLVCTVIGDLKKASWDEGYAIDWYYRNTTPAFCSPKYALKVLSTRRQPPAKEQIRTHLQRTLQKFVPVTILYEAIIPNVFPQMGGNTKGMFRAFSLPDTVPEDIVPLRSIFEGDEEEDLAQEPIQSEQQIVEKVPTKRVSILYELAIPVKAKSIELKEYGEFEESEWKRIAVIFETNLPTELPEEIVQLAVSPGGDAILPGTDEEKEIEEDSTRMVTVMYETTLLNMPDGEGSQLVTSTEENEKRDWTEQKVIIVYVTDRNTAAGMLRVFEDKNAHQFTTTFKVESELQAEDEETERDIQATSETDEFAGKERYKEYEMTLSAQIKDSYRYNSMEGLPTTMKGKRPRDLDWAEKWRTEDGPEIFGPTKATYAVRRSPEVLEEPNDLLVQESNAGTATLEVETVLQPEKGETEEIKSTSPLEVIELYRHKPTSQTVLSDTSEVEMTRYQLKGVTRKTEDKPKTYGSSKATRARKATLKVETVLQPEDGGTEKDIQAISENVEFAAEGGSEIEITLPVQFSDICRYRPTYENVVPDKSKVEGPKHRRRGMTWKTEYGLEAYGVGLQDDASKMHKFKKYTDAEKAEIENLYYKLMAEIEGSSDEETRSSVQGKHANEKEALEQEWQRQRSDSDDIDIRKLFKKLLACLRDSSLHRLGAPKYETLEDERLRVPRGPSPIPMEEKQEFGEHTGRRMFIFNSSILRAIMRTLASMDKVKELHSAIALSVIDEDLEAMRLDYKPSLTHEEESLLDLAENEDWLWKSRQVTVVYETVIPEVFEQAGDRVALKGYPLRRWISSLTTMELLSQMYPKFDEDSLLNMTERMSLIDPSIMPHLGEIWKKAQSVPSESSLIGVDCNVSQISLTKGLDDPRTLCQRMAVLNCSFIPILYHMLNKGENEEDDHSIASYHGILCQDETGEIIDIEEEEIELYMERTSMASLHDNPYNFDELGRRIAIVYETTIPFEQMAQHMDPDLLDLLQELKRGRPLIYDANVLHQRKAFVEDSIVPQAINLIDESDEIPVCITQLTRYSSRSSDISEPLFRIESEDMFARRKHKMVTVDDDLIPRILRVLYKNAQELEGLLGGVRPAPTPPGPPEASVGDKKKVLIVPRVTMVLDNILQEMKEEPGADHGIAGSGKIAVVENSLIMNIFDDLLGSELQMQKLAKGAAKPSVSETLVKSKEGAREGHERWRKWIKEEDIVHPGEKYRTDTVTRVSEGEEGEASQVRGRAEIPGVPSGTTFYSLSLSSTESVDSLLLQAEMLFRVREETFQDEPEVHVEISKSEDIFEDMVATSDWEEEYEESEEDLGGEYDVPKVIPKILRKMRTKANEWMNLYGCIGVVSQLDESRLVWRWARTDTELDDPKSPLIGKIRWRMSGLMVAMIDNPVMPRILRELFFDAKRATYIAPIESAEGGMELINIMKFRKYADIPFAAHLDCHLLPRIVRELMECARASKGESVLRAIREVTPEDDNIDEIKDDDCPWKDRLWTGVDKFPSPWLTKVLGDDINERSLEILDLGAARYERLLQIRGAHEARRPTPYPDKNQLTLAILETIQDLQELEGMHAKTDSRQLSPYAYLGNRLDSEIKEEPKKDVPGEEHTYSPSRGFPRTPFPHMCTMIANVLQKIDDEENIREREQLYAGAAEDEAGRQDTRPPGRRAFALTSSDNLDEYRDLARIVPGTGAEDDEEDEAGREDRRRPGRRAFALTSSDNLDEYRNLAKIVPGTGAEDDEEDEAGREDRRRPGRRAFALTSSDNLDEYRNLAKIVPGTGAEDDEEDEAGREDRRRPGRRAFALTSSDNLDEYRNLAKIVPGTGAEDEEGEEDAAGREDRRRPGRRAFALTSSDNLDEYRDLARIVPGTGAEDEEVPQDEPGREDRRRPGRRAFALTSSDNLDEYRDLARIVPGTGAEDEEVPQDEPGREDRRRPGRRAFALTSSDNLDEYRDLARIVPGTGAEDEEEPQDEPGREDRRRAGRRAFALTSSDNLDEYRDLARIVPGTGAEDDDKADEQDAAGREDRRRPGRRAFALTSSDNLDEYRDLARLVTGTDTEEGVTEDDDIESGQWAFALTGSYIPDLLQSLSRSIRDKIGSKEEEEVVASAQGIINEMLGSLSDGRDPDTESKEQGEVFRIMSSAMKELKDNVEQGRESRAEASKIISQIALGESRASLSAFNKESGMSRRMLVSPNSIISAVEDMLPGDEGMRTRMTGRGPGAGQMMIVIDDVIISKVIQMLTNDPERGGISEMTLGRSYQDLRTRSSSRGIIDGQIRSDLSTEQAYTPKGGIRSMSTDLVQEGEEEDQRGIRSERPVDLGEELGEEEYEEESKEPEGQEEVSESKKLKTKKSVKFEDEELRRPSSEFHGFRRLSRKKVSIVEEAFIPKILQMLAKEATIELTAEEAKEILETSDEGTTLQQLGAHYWARRRISLSEELPTNIFQLLERIVEEGRIPASYTDIMEMIDEKERAVSLEIAHDAITKTIERLSSTEGIADEDQAAAERVKSSVDTARDVLKRMLVKFQDIDEEADISGRASSTQLVRGAMSEVLQGYQRNEPEISGRESSLQIRRGAMSGVFQEYLEKPVVKSYRLGMDEEEEEDTAKDKQKKPKWDLKVPVIAEEDEDAAEEDEDKKIGLESKDEIITEDTPAAVDEDKEKKIGLESKEETITGDTPATVEEDEEKRIGLESEEERITGDTPAAEGLYDSPSKIASLVEFIGLTEKDIRVAVIKDHKIPEVLGKLSDDSRRSSSPSATDGQQQTSQTQVSNIQESDARATTIQNIIIPAIREMLNVECEGKTDSTTAIEDEERLSCSESKDEKKTRIMAIVNDTYIPMILEMLHGSTQGEDDAKPTDQMLQSSDEEFTESAPRGLEFYLDLTGRKMLIFDNSLLPTLFELSEGEGWSRPSASTGMIRGIEDQDKETLDSQSQKMIIISGCILSSLLGEMGLDIATPIPYPGLEAKRKGIFKEVSAEAFGVREEREGKLTLIYETLFPRRFLYVLSELPFQVDKTLVSPAKEISDTEKGEFLSATGVRGPILLKLVRMFESFGQDDISLPLDDEGAEDSDDSSEVSSVKSERHTIVNDTILNVILRGLMDNADEKICSDELNSDLEEGEMESEIDEESFDSSDVSTGDIYLSEDVYSTDHEDFESFIDSPDLEDDLLVKLRNNDEKLQVDIHEKVYVRTSGGDGDKYELQDPFGEIYSEKRDAIFQSVDHGKPGSRAFNECDEGSSSTSITEFKGQERKTRRSFIFHAIVSEQTQGIMSKYEDTAMLRQSQSIVDDPILRFEFLRILSRKADEIMANRGQSDAIADIVTRSYRILRALTDISKFPAGLVGRMNRRDGIVEDPVLRLKILRALSDISRNDVQRRGKKDGIADERVLKAHIFLGMQNEPQENVAAVRRSFAGRDLYKIKKAHSWPILDPEEEENIRRNTIFGDLSSRFQRRKVMREYKLPSSVFKDNINTKQDKQHTIVSSPFRNLDMFEGSSSYHMNDETRQFAHSDDDILHSSFKPKRAKEYVGLFGPSVDIVSDPGHAGSMEVCAKDSVWERFRDLKRYSERLTIQQSATEPSEIDRQEGDEKSSSKPELKEETIRTSRRDHNFPPRERQRSMSWPRRERKMRRERIPEIEYDPVILSEMIFRLYETSEEDLDDIISRKRKSQGVSELYVQNSVSYPVVDRSKHSELRESFIEIFGVGGQTEVTIDDPGILSDFNNIQSMKKRLTEEKRKSGRSRFESGDEIVTSARTLLNSSGENNLGGGQQGALSEDPILTDRILRAMQRISVGHGSMDRARSSFVENSDSAKVFETLISSIVGEDSAVRGSNAVDPFLVSELVQRLVGNSEDDIVTTQLEDLRGMEEMQYSIVENPFLRSRILQALSIMSEEDEEVRQRRDAVVSELLQRMEIFLDTSGLSGGRVDEKERRVDVIPDPVLRLLILLALSKRPDEEFRATGVGGVRETIVNDPVLRTNILLELAKPPEKQDRMQIRREAVVDDLVLRTKILLTLAKLPEDGHEKEKGGDRLVEDRLFRAMLVLALSELPQYDLQERKLWEMITDDIASRAIAHDFASSDAGRLPEHDPDEGLWVIQDNYERMGQSEEIAEYSNARTRILQGLYKMSEGLQNKERRHAATHDPDLGTSILLSLSELPEETHGRMGRRKATIIDDPHIRSKIIVALSKLPKETDRRLLKRDAIIESVSLRKKIFLAFSKQREEFEMLEDRSSEGDESFKVSHLRPRSHSWPGDYDEKKGGRRVVYKSAAILKDLIRRLLNTSKQEEVMRRRATSIVDEPFLRLKIIDALSRMYEDTEKLLDDSWKEKGHDQKDFIDPDLRRSILTAMSEMSDEDLGRRKRRDAVEHGRSTLRRWRRRSRSWPAGYRRGKFRRGAISDDPVILSETLQRLLTESNRISQESHEDLERRESDHSDAEFVSSPTKEISRSNGMSEEFDCGDSMEALHGDSYHTQPSSEEIGEESEADLRKRIFEVIALQSQEHIEFKERGYSLIDDTDLRKSLLLSLTKISEEVYGRKGRGSSAIADSALRSRILLSLSNQKVYGRWHHRDAIVDEPGLREKIVEAVTEMAEKDLERKERRDAIIDNPVLRMTILKALSSEVDNGKPSISKTSGRGESYEDSDQQFSMSGKHSMKRDHESSLMADYDTTPRISRRSSSWPEFDYSGRRARAYTILGQSDSMYPFPGSLIVKERIKTVDPSKSCALMRSEERPIRKKVINYFASDSIHTSGLTNEVDSIQEEDCRGRRLSSRMSDGRLSLSRRRGLSWPGDCSRRGLGNKTIPDFSIIRRWMEEALRKPSTEGFQSNTKGEAVLVESLLKMGVLQAVLRALDDEYILVPSEEEVEEEEVPPTETEEPPVEVLYRAPRRNMLDIFGPGTLVQKMIMINDNVMPDILHSLTGLEEIDRTSPPCAGVIVEEHGTDKLILQNWSPCDTLRQLSQTIIPGSTYSSQRYVARRMTVVLGSVISDILPKITSGAFDEQRSLQLKVRNDFDENITRPRQVDQFLGLPRIANIERKLSDECIGGKESETKITVDNDVPHILQRAREVYKESELPCLASDIGNMKDDDQLSIMIEVLDKAWQDTIDKFWQINVLGEIVDSRDLSSHRITGFQNINPQMETSPGEGEPQQKSEELIAERISYSNDPRKVLIEWRRKSEYGVGPQDKDGSASKGTQRQKSILNWGKNPLNDIDLTQSPEEVTGATVQEMEYVTDTDENDPKRYIATSEEMFYKDDDSDEVRTKTSKHTGHSKSSGFEYVMESGSCDDKFDESLLLNAPRVREPIKPPGGIGVDSIRLGEKVQDWLGIIVDSFCEESELKPYAKSDEYLDRGLDPKYDIGFVPKVVVTPKPVQEDPSIISESIEEILPTRKSIPPKRITFWDNVPESVDIPVDISPTPATSIYGTYNIDIIKEDEEDVRDLVSSAPTVHRETALISYSYPDEEHSETTSSLSLINPTYGTETKSFDTDLMNQLSKLEYDLPRESILKRKIGFSYDGEPDDDYIPSSRQPTPYDKRSEEMSVTSALIRRFGDEELSKIHRRMTRAISEFTGLEPQAVDRKRMYKFVPPKDQVATPEIFPSQGVLLLLNIQRTLDKIMGHKMPTAYDMHRNLTEREKKAIDVYTRKMKDMCRSGVMEDGMYGVFEERQVMRWLHITIVLDFLRKGCFEGFPEIDAGISNLQTMEQRAIVTYVTGRGGCVLPENITETMGIRAWMRADEFWGRDQVGLEDEYFPTLAKSIPKRKVPFKLTGYLGPAGICNLIDVGQVTKLNLLKELSKKPTFMPFNAGDVPEQINLVEDSDEEEEEENQSASAWLMMENYRDFIEHQTDEADIRLERMKRIIAEVMLIRFWELNQNDDVRLPLYEYDVNTYFKDLDEEWQIGRMTLMNNLLEEDFNDEFALGIYLKERIPDIETRVPYTVQDSYIEAKMIVSSLTEPRDSTTYMNETDRANAIFIQLKMQHRRGLKIRRFLIYYRSLLKRLHIRKLELDLKKLSYKKKVPKRVLREVVWEEEEVPLLNDVVTPWANIRAITERNKKRVKELKRTRFVKRVFEPSHSYLLLKKSFHSKGQKRAILHRQMIYENYTIMDTISSLLKYYNETFQIVCKEKMIATIQNQNKGIILVTILQRLDDFLLPDTLRDGVRKVLKILEPKNILEKPLLRRMFRPYLMEGWDLSHMYTLSFYEKDHMFFKSIRKEVHKEEKVQSQIEEELGADRRIKELYRAALGDPEMEPLLTNLMGPLGKLSTEIRLMSDILEPSILDLEDMWGMEEITQFSEFRQNVITQRRDRIIYRILHVKKFFEVLQNMRISNDILDMKIFDLWKLKNEVICSITAETLRMARSTRHVVNTIHEAARIMDLLNRLGEYQKEVTRLMDTLSDVELSVYRCQNEYEESMEEGAYIDEICKEEAMKLKPRAIINYMKSYLKRPSSMIKVLMMESLLHMVYNNFWKDGLTYITEDCLDFYQEVIDLEHYDYAPQDISPELWDQLCHLRRIRLMSELKTRVAALNYAEAENTLQYYTDIFLLQYYKLNSLKEYINESLDNWVKRFTSIPMQLTIKPPKILAPQPEFKSEFPPNVKCISESYVTKIKLDYQKLRDRLKKLQKYRRRMKVRLVAAEGERTTAFISFRYYRRYERVLIQNLQNGRFVRLVKNLIGGKILPWYLPSMSSPSKEMAIILVRRMKRVFIILDRYKRACERVRLVNELLYEEIEKASYIATNITKLLEEHPLYISTEDYLEAADINLDLLYHLSTLKKIHTENIVEIKKLHLEVEMYRMKKYPVLKPQNQRS